MVKSKTSRKPSHAVSAISGSKLQGVPKRTVSQMKKLSKTQKRPERKFGGVLSHKIVAQLIKEKARLQTGVIGEDEVPITHLQYIKKMK
ncbi:hypothetical protein HUU53_04410 [Candidatus Micrarchaeota archaeon]|nr:hypothetical protein [Candidatus Micrarchaeota archaeon]